MATGSFLRGFLVGFIVVFNAKNCKGGAKLRKELGF
jgi:hypothetical protein